MNETSRRRALAPAVRAGRRQRRSPRARCRGSPARRAGRRRPRPAKTLRILQWSHFVPGYDRWFDEVYTKEWGAPQRDRRHRRPHGGDRGQRARRRRGGREEGARPLPLHLAAGGLRGPGHRPPGDRRGGRAAAREDDPARRRGPRSIRRPESTSRSPTPTCRIRATTGSTSGARSAIPNGPGHLGGPARAAAGRSRRSSATRSASGLSQEMDSNMVAARPALVLRRRGAGRAGPRRRSTRRRRSRRSKFMRALYQETETPEVFTWDPSSNNRMMLAGRASFVQNAISVTRTAEKENPAMAKKIGLVPALAGTGAADRGRARHELLRDLEVRRRTSTGRSSSSSTSSTTSGRSSGRASSTTSRATRRPCRTSRSRSRTTRRPIRPGKYEVLSGVLDWATNVGYPGYATAAIDEVFNTFVIPTMFARVARDEVTAAGRGARRRRRTLERIFAKWR